MRRLLRAEAMILLALGGCWSASPEAAVETRTVGAGDIELLPVEARFVAVRDVVLAAGSLWVLDGAPRFLTRVSLDDGSFVQFGNEGQGPGEFIDPRAIQPTTRSDTFGVRVWDFGNVRVSTFDASGGLRASEMLSDNGMVRARTDIRDVSYADPFRIREDGVGVVFSQFPRRVDRTADITTGSLWRADERLEPGTALARFADHAEKGAASLREWTAVPLWDACDNAVVLWSPESAEVAWLDAQGRVTAAVPVQVTSAPLSMADIEAYLRWMGRLELGPDYEEAGVDYARMARAYRDRFAERKPVATDVRCQSQEVAWLQLFDTSSDPLGRGQTWLRVSKDGPSQRFKFPEVFTPAVYTEQGVYGLYEAQQGYQRLGWWSDEPTG